LYGGSVKVTNAKEVLKLNNVDGILVGSAALKAEDFCRMIEYAQLTKA
jgi:triosephosphate isomerase